MLQRYLKAEQYAKEYVDDTYQNMYDDFPEYKKLETIFMVDARRILRFQTLDENKIKRNDIISLFVVDPE